MGGPFNWNLKIILSFFKNVPSGNVLGLAGYTQSSGHGELSLKNTMDTLLMVYEP